jgi:chitinase
VRNQEGSVMKPYRVFLLGAALALPALCALAAAAPSQPVVVGYVFPRGAVLQPGQIRNKSLNRINYAFANIQDGRLVSGYPSDEQNFAFLHALRREDPSLKILVSVGGWLWSGGFSDMALTPASRQVFLQSVLDFLGRNHLDGLDIDWEYPGSVGAGNRFRPEDKQNYTLLLKELRSAFNQETSRTHKRLYLTIAAGASDEFLGNTEMAEVAKYVDTVNLMTYDFTEAGVDALTGHNAPLYANPQDVRHTSSDAAVKAFEHAGVPAAKILLGVPFYARMWGDVGPANHGLFQPGKALPKDSPWPALRPEELLTRGFVRYWDSDASAPYLYNEQEHVFVSYDDPQSLTIKGHYVRAQRLGGIMFWEYFNDPSGKLLDAVNLSLHVVDRPLRREQGPSGP